MFKKYEEALFIHTDKNEEWEKMEPSAKALVIKHLSNSMENTEIKISLEMMASSINDLEERIEGLERGMRPIKE